MKKPIITKPTIRKPFSNKKKTLNKNQIAVYPGSFSPFHFGHLLVVKAALAYYDKLIILVAHNPNKVNNLLVDNSYKKELIEKVLVSEKINEKVQVDILNIDGKVVDYLQEINTNTLVRGFWKENLPEPFDLKLDRDEMHLSNCYLESNPELKLHFIVTDLKISSTQVHQALFLEKDVKKMIHPSIINEVKKTWSRKT